MQFPGEVTSRLPKTGTTIFTVMSKLAAEVGATNLSQGFPDYSSSQDLFDKVHHYMTKGFNQYAPMPGFIGLREAIAEKIEKLHAIKYNPDTEVTITAGATLAIYTAIAALIREGDEVIVFEPAYDSYSPSILLNGGIPIYVQLKQPDFHIHWNEVRKLVSPRTKMIIINTPHNPTGSVLSETDLQELEKITMNTNIIVLSDEVYEHIIFDGQQHQSVCRFPKLAERSLAVFSFGKTFHNTGWKMGYVVGPENLMTEYRKAHQYIVFSCNTPIQMALADFLKEENNYLSLPNFYQQKRDYFNSLIKNSRFSFVPSAGTYFQLVKYENISQEKDTDFAVRITKENKVASIPISVFYNQGVDNKYIRFCFAKTDEVLAAAAEKLCKI
jgi:methionine aminotransferase